MTAREGETATEFAIRVVKEQGARDVLTALRDRCGDDIRALMELADEQESERLAGKANGVSLVLSRIDEMIRGLDQ